jgi:hypothetical protein
MGEFIFLFSAAWIIINRGVNGVNYREQFRSFAGLLE